MTAPQAAQTKLDCYQHHETGQLSFRERRWLSARDTFVRCAAESCPTAIRADCVDWVDRIDRSLPSVVVTAKAAGEDIVDVKVIVDGQVTAEGLTGVAIRLDPGQHKLRFESPHGSPVERTILVNEGIRERPIEIAFVSPAAETLSARAKPLPPKPRPETFDYTMGAVAVAAWGTFLVAGTWGLYQRHQLQNECAPVCHEARVDPVAVKLVVADVALLAAALSSSILYLRLTRRPSGTVDTGRTARISPFAQARGGGAACGIAGAF